MEEKGVWRTVRGRRVFIEEGQSLKDAMAKSGKFKKLATTKKVNRSFDYSLFICYNYSEG